jgi:hypothetical protein
MRRAVAVAVAIALAFGFAFACGSSDEGDGGATAEAGSDAAKDGQTDGGLDGNSCAPANPIAAGFGSWLTDGPVVLDGDVAILTPASADTSASIGWPEPHLFEAFVAKFALRIRAGSPSGEGVAFVWTSAPPPATGAPGSNLGACGLGGYAVAFDTAPDAGTGVLVKIMRLEGVNGCPNAPIASVMASGDLADNAFHAVQVTLASGSVEVSVDGAKALTATLPGYAPFEGYVMFTAATSSRFAEHAVKSPSVELPKEPRCP